MIVAHIFGIPIEEAAGQLGSAAAVTMTVICVAGRSKLGRVLGRIRRH